ncbi:MAG: alanine--glyoxylate aminotransferase family protein [Candidatus Krumholzibacteriota bacterium]|nr:alanine--glyoxylate aminotransferase family protein [Candidatus Krumholzibacteriota bacterium]
MNADDTILMTPGPVHIQRSSWDGLENLHHRTGRFREIVLEIEAGLRKLAGTSSPAYLLTASGTGAMESAIVNLTVPGSKVLVVSGGKFGDRWKELADSNRCSTDILKFEPGRAIDIEMVRDRIAATRPEFLAVTHVESTSGLLLDLERLAKALSEERPYLIVDAIASLGSEDLRFDDWGIDLLVGAGQKALQAPAGISFVLISERARAKALKNSPSGYYLSYEKYDGGRASGDLPFTPAIDSFQLLHRSLGKISATGKDIWLERQRASSASLVEAASFLGLALFAETPSSSVQAFIIPETVDAGDLIDAVAEREGIIITGGQGILEGKIIRTGFTGLYSRDIVARLIKALGRSLEERGLEVDIERALHCLMRS